MNLINFVVIDYLFLGVAGQVLFADTIAMISTEAYRGRAR